MEKALKYSNTIVRVTPIWVFLPRGRLLVSFLVFCLVGSWAFGQQSYIPWSEGLAPTRNPTGSGSRPGSTASTGGLSAPNSSTTSAIDFAQVYQDNLRTVQLTNPLDDSSEPRLRPEDVPTFSYEGLPQPPPPAAFTPGDSATAEDAFNTGPKTYQGFGTRLFNAYFNPEDVEEEAASNNRRGLTIPWDSPPFPFSDHMGPNIGYRDTSVYPLMDAIYHGPNGDWWKKSRIKI
jgi:hypothetical protein